VRSFSHCSRYCAIHELIMMCLVRISYTAIHGVFLP
jgi:hypothetical protein